MIRLLVWMAGNCLLVYAVARYGYWHEFIALAVLAAASAWIFGGALWLSRSMRGGTGGFMKRAAEAAAMRESVRHAEETRKAAEAAK